MVETKREIIFEEGVPVKVLNSSKEVIYDTVALVGKATKQFASEISLESHRQAQFLPEVNVENGLLVENTISKEFCIVVANYPEVIDRQLCANVARMIVCNSTLSVTSFDEQADKFGNIKRTLVTKYNELPVYADVIKNELKSKDPGYEHETLYKLYCPYIDVTVTDTVDLNEVNRSVKYRVVGINNLTFKGMTLLDVVTETRR